MAEDARLSSGMQDGKIDDTQGGQLMCGKSNDHDEEG
jgi:hypothetical protein